MTTFADFVDELLRAIEKRRREDHQVMREMRALIAAASKPGDKQQEFKTDKATLRPNKG